MKFIKIRNPDSKEFKEAWKIYKSSFPLDERRDLDSQSKLMKNKLYNLFAVIEANILVAIIAHWNFTSFLFVEHLAVRHDLRGQRTGAKLLKKYLSRSKQKVILEVERPNTEIATKRIRFYEKFGFKLCRYGYVQPPYGKDKDPVPMFLMAYPENISKSEFSLIREKLHTNVYGLKKPLVDY